MSEKMSEKQESTQETKSGFRFVFNIISEINTLEKLPEMDHHHRLVG